MNINIDNEEIIKIIINYYKEIIDNTKNLQIRSEPFACFDDVNTRFKDFMYKSNKKITCNYSSFN